MSTARHNQAQHPDYRRAARGSAGRGLCRRCLAEVPKGRKTFCGDGCVQAFQVATGNSAWVRAALLERDRGVCQLCQLDTLHWHEVTKATARLIVNRTDDQDALQADLAQRLAAAGLTRLSPYRGGYNPARLLKVWLHIRRGWPPRKAWEGKSPWEADHTVPVVEGGGGCGLDGYRTLCQPCHVRETAALAARLAARRRTA